MDRNLGKFTTSEILVNCMKKMMFCLKIGIFSLLANGRKLLAWFGCRRRRRPCRRRRQQFLSSLFSSETTRLISLKFSMELL